MGYILVQAIEIYIDIVILNVILSWVTMALPNVRFLFIVQRILDRVVEPAMFPIRRAVRPYTRDVPLDFSPIILVVILKLLEAFILRVFGG